MGKCLSTYNRIENYDPKQTGTEIYDKFGNLIAGGSNRVEIHYKGRILYFTNSIQRVMNDFEFLEDDIFRLWRHFVKIDRDQINYISIGQLFSYLDERHYSIVAPYLERFFDLIDREFIEKVNFDEFLPALVSFCLFSKDEMITFVFNMFDRDRDGEISKKDLFRLFTIVIDNIQVFPINNLRAIELISMERGDKMSKNDFIKVVQQLPYTVFPSFRLQGEMRETFGGGRFWRKCKIRLDKKEQERKMMVEREKFFEKSKSKKEIDYQDKLEFYEAKVKEMNQAYYKRQKMLRDKMSLVRVKGRRGSDGMIGVVPFLEEFREDLDKLAEKRKNIKEENPYDFPIMKDRMHYSFIWDRYTLFELENVEENIAIDPTDNRLNLQEEIQKFMNKQNQKGKKKAEVSISTDSDADDAVSKTNKDASQYHSQSVSGLQLRVNRTDDQLSSETELNPSEILRIAQNLSDIRGAASRQKNRDKIQSQSDSALKESLIAQSQDDDASQLKQSLDDDYGEEYAEEEDPDDEEVKKRKEIEYQISRHQALLNKKNSFLPAAFRNSNSIFNGDSRNIANRIASLRSSVSGGNQDKSKLSSKSSINQQQTIPKNQKLPPINHQPSQQSRSRIGDETLSQLSKQFPVNKKSKLMGDETLSNLEKQFPLQPSNNNQLTPGMTLGKKFKMMRNKEIDRVDKDDGGQSLKSKWTVITNDKDKKVVLEGNKNLLQQNPQMPDAKKQRMEALVRFYQFISLEQTNKNLEAWCRTINRNIRSFECNYVK
ncbi:ef hand family protein [Stylonychia lemnae]|uniref:Ef hand family protein n=1 Tax=Stylonychia lemnae TaxID=5949 RepID=A0A078AF11_STYLE|nr:ef hand family protein [Stylonychia lemnae]|eukprot:CDW80386.1 ef hand family protein [Stylonychia lemnae]